MSVLIVDHNPSMRDMLKSVLRSVSGELYECADAASVLGAYARLRPMWVVIDIGVDTMDGLAATRALCALDARARVIIMGDYADQGFRRAAMNAGAHAYVVKDDLLSLPDVITSAPTAELDPRAARRTLNSDLEDAS